MGGVKGGKGGVRRLGGVNARDAFDKTERSTLGIQKKREVQNRTIYQHLMTRESSIVWDRSSTAGCL